MKLSNRELDALKAIEIATMVAKNRGQDCFAKDQLQDGIGWITLQRLEERGLIIQLGDQLVRITEKGVARLAER